MGKDIQAMVSSSARPGVPAARTCWIREELPASGSLPGEQRWSTLGPRHQGPLVSDLERQIDQQVYKLYGLTAEEVAIVERVQK